MSPLRTPPRRLARLRAGFSLVEVAVAATVMAIVISTSLTVLQFGFRAIDTARNTTVAGQVMQSLVEDLRMQTWTSITGLPSTLTGTLSTFDTTSGHVQSGSFTGYSATESAILNRFTITRTVADKSGYNAYGTSSSTMKEIVFTITWKGADGRSHSLQYTTYYAKDGLYAYYIS